MLPLLALSLLLTLGGNEQTTAPPVTVALLPIGVTTTPAVSVRLRLENRTARPLILYTATLPWVGRSGIDLFLLPSPDRSQMLTPLLPEEDVAVGTTTIPPGAFVEGTLDLTARFRGLREALRQGDVFVFWRYRVDGPSLKGNEEYFGGLRISRQSK